MLFAKALTAHLPPTSPIIVNSVNPGWCVSDLRRASTGVTRKLVEFVDCLLALPTEQGARQLVWAAVGGEGKEDELRGAYISEDEVKEASDFVISAKGKEVEEQIWVRVFLARMERKVAHYLSDCRKRLLIYFQKFHQSLGSSLESTG